MNNTFRAALGEIKKYEDYYGDCTLPPGKSDCPLNRDLVQLISEESTGKINQGDIVPRAGADYWVETQRQKNPNVKFWYEPIWG